MSCLGEADVTGLCSATVAQWRQVYPAVEVLGWLAVASMVMVAGTVAAVLLVQWRKWMVRQRERAALAAARRRIREVRGRRGRPVYPVRCEVSETVFLPRAGSRSRPDGGGSGGNRQT